MEHWINLIKTKLEIWITGFIKLLPNLVLAALVFTVFFLVSRYLRRIIYRALLKFSDKPAVSELEGKDLNILQMSLRGVVVFFIALLLLRISGRRSFGLHTPLDNIITITLGAVLSRAIVGASAFLPVIVCSIVIVLLHRFIGWTIIHHPRFSRFVQGEKMILFSDGRFQKENMDKAIVCQEDIMQGVRKTALTSDMEKIEQVYIERNGEISSIKKSS